MWSAGRIPGQPSHAPLRRLLSCLMQCIVHEVTRAAAPCSWNTRVVWAAKYACRRVSHRRRAGVLRGIHWFTGSVWPSRHKPPACARQVCRTRALPPKQGEGSQFTVMQAARSRDVRLLRLPAQEPARQSIEQRAVPSLGGGGGGLAAAGAGHAQCPPSRNARPCATSSVRIWC